ncbi:MAG TPA: CHRD domain-containing protein [Flavobacterium sp.]
MNSSLMTFTANLNGTNEVPMPDNPSNETGKAILTFDDTTKIFTVTVTHSIISPVSGHIYIGEADESGNPIFTFTSSISPIYYSSPPLTDSQEADLKSNLFYINILTEAHRTGEIRGQFIELTSK